MNATNTDKKNPNPALHSYPTLNSWLQNHITLAIFILICIGFIIRLQASSATFLNPDEALHYLIAHQPSSLLAYKASLSNAHPPFYFIFLYFWRFIGNTELILRLPSVASSMIFIWILFLWLKNIFNRQTALIGVLIATFSPALIALASEVRAYSLLLLFMVCTLYFLERSLKEKSKKLLVLSSLFLFLSILTHYSAIWFTSTIIIYTFIRVLHDHLVKRFMTLWITIQLATVSLYVFLYTTHISQLRHGILEQEAVQGWLRASYFDQRQSSVLMYISRNTFDVFYYLFSHPIIGFIMLLLYFIGIGILLWKKQNSQTAKIYPRHLAILLFLPLVIACMASIIGLYPYGSTRHSIFLIIFAIPAVSFFLERVTRGRMLPILFAAILFIPKWHTIAVAPIQNIKKEQQQKQRMNSMMAFIENTIPKDALIFVDYQTDSLLGYYMGKNQFYRDIPSNGFLESYYEGRRVLSSTVWSFDQNTFFVEFDRLNRAFTNTEKQSVWVIQAGWGPTMYGTLTKRYGNTSRQRMMFSENIMVFHIQSNERLSK